MVVFNEQHSHLIEKLIKQLGYEQYIQKVYIKKINKLQAKQTDARVDTRVKPNACPRIV